MANNTPVSTRNKKPIPPTVNDTLSVVDYVSWHPDLYARMVKYIQKKRSVNKTQDLARLAMSYFLDREGF